MANSSLAPLHTAVATMLKQFGVSCKLEKVDGTAASVTGIIMTAQTEPGADNANRWTSNNERVCYLSGKIKLAPEPGDTITFSPNIYAINDVRTITVGEGKKNVFAYRLVLGTS